MYDCTDCLPRDSKLGTYQFLGPPLEGRMPSSDTWRATNICSQKPELPGRPCAQYAQADLVDVVSSKIPSEQQRSHYSRAECSEDVYVLRNELGIFVTIFDTFDFRICQLGETSQSWSTLSTFQVVKLVKLVKVWSF